MTLKNTSYTLNMYEYTDGSKIDDKTGAGIIVYKDNEFIYRQSYSLPDRASIFQAELEAIRLAAAFFNRNKQLPS